MKKKELRELCQDAGKVWNEARQARPELLVTDCGDCGLQIQAETGTKIMHPVIVLNEAYRTNRSQPELNPAAHERSQFGWATLGLCLKNTVVRRRTMKKDANSRIYGVGFVSRFKSLSRGWSLALAIIMIAALLFFAVSPGGQRRGIGFSKEAHQFLPSVPAWWVS